jgi:tRNA1Val (adenine37-N6)-methyltransferase
MANQWFKFKKFIIHQDQCAMKVGTDGVILGEWVNIKGAKRILDIGTGTGLIALMLAQRNSSVEIDAIEIDPDAANQAAHNVAGSPYNSRIKIMEMDFRMYCKENPSIYDLIVCNPPYFSDSFKSTDKKRSIARHSDTLQISDLIRGVKFLLKPSGHFGIIIPQDQKKSFVDMAHEHDLFLNRLIEIRPIPGKEAKRYCLELSNRKTEIKQETLIIEAEGRHNYSKEYIELTKDFYLKEH